MRLILRAELVSVGVTIRGEGNPLSVRAVAAFGIVATGFRQVNRIAAIEFGGVNLVVLVVVPRVAPLGGRGALFDFILLFLNCGRIGMGGGIKIMRSVRMQP